MKMILKAPAKINLGLEITGKRDDGYHTLETIFCQISLYDEVLIEEIDRDTISVEAHSASVPNDEKNTAYKAALLIKNLFTVSKGVKISINKNIPVQAGLGGGSSDGAAVLLGLNSLWKLNIPTKRLMEIAVKIGADVSYPVIGKTQFAKGIGELLEELPSFSGKHILVCVPDKRVSTKWAFEQIDLSNIHTHKMEQLLLAVKRQDLEKIGRNLFNEFEEIVGGKIPDILTLKKVMIENGALGAVLTGSGSGVFGIFDDEKKTEQAFQILKKDYKNTFMVETL